MNKVSWLYKRRTLTEHLQKLYYLEDTALFFLAPENPYERLWMSSTAARWLKAPGTRKVGFEF